jgi:hypothetical protein
MELNGFESDGWIDLCDEKASITLKRLNYWQNPVAVKRLTDSPLF